LRAAQKFFLSNACHREATTAKQIRKPFRRFVVGSFFLASGEKAPDMYQKYLQNQNLAQDLGQGLGQDLGLSHTSQSIREPELLVPLIQCHK